MKKIRYFSIMVMILTFFLFYENDINASSRYSGTCGAALEWKIDSSGCLVISGQGEMYDYGDDTYAPWFVYRSDIDEIKILSGVTTIGNAAFFDCRNVSTVQLGSDIVSIGDQAFRECVEIGFMTLPNGLKSIGIYAFYGCNDLFTVSIPGNVTSIGKGAFANCARLESVTVNGAVKKIEDNTFNNCLALASVILPKSITSIGDNAFNMCKKLSAIFLPEGLEKIGVSAFGSCSSLQSVVLPKSLKTIQHSAFSQCTALENVEIPEAVTMVEDQAFYGCSRLKNIAFLGKSYSVGQYVLLNCSANGSVCGYTNTNAKRVADSVQWTFYPYDAEAGYKVELGSQMYEYDGKEKRPSVTVRFGDKVLKNDVDYVVSYKDNVNAGKGTVLIQGKGIYTAKIKNLFSIQPKNLKELQVTIAQNAYVYDGTDKKPEVEIKMAGYTLVPSVDYDVVYTNNRNAGTAGITLIGKNNYIGKIIEKFEIKKAKRVISAESYTKTIGSKNFTIKAKTVAKGKLTFKSDNTSVAAVDKNGKVKIKQCGKATITITCAAAANYNKGTKKISITVVPKKVQITSSKLKKKTWQIKWKTDKKVTGYHIYFSENKNFNKNGKGDVLEKYLPLKKSGTMTIDSLDKGKTYYIKIRAYKKVKGKNYFGAWSTVKKIKTK